VSFDLATRYNIDKAGEAGEAGEMIAATQRRGMKSSMERR
jgi:hypothetical protein